MTIAPVPGWDIWPSIPSSIDITRTGGFKSFSVESAFSDHRPIERLLMMVEMWTIVDIMDH